MPPDPLALLRVPGPAEAYPAEPSDEEVARQVGLDPRQVVRFDMNTLGGGPLPGAARGLAAYSAARLVEYGDQAYRRLRAAISGVTGVPPQRIVPGAGADELIRLVTGMTVGPGDAVLVPTPTFPMFAVEARLAGAEVIEVARREPRERQPVERIGSAARVNRARLVWLCSPNNPTGDAFPRAEIEAMVAALPAIVVVDAVYQELAEASLGLGPEALSLVPLQDRHPNLVVLRSLAKAYGLAGARVGYLVVAEALATRFDASRLPLAIGGPSEAAAIGALDEPEVARERHRLMVGERRRLSDALAARGWEVLPSVTNFVLVRPPTDAARLADALLKRGLVLRSWSSGPLREWLRITARAPHENDRLLTALAEVGERP
ncbi:MAG TPA: histidinol-phosphate transaminase [Candidatus Limnocylindria bacterium]